MAMRRDQAARSTDLPLMPYQTDIFCLASHDPPRVRRRDLMTLIGAVKSPTDRSPPDGFGISRINTIAHCSLTVPSLTMALKHSMMSQRSAVLRKAICLG